MSADSRAIARRARYERRLRTGAARLKRRPNPSRSEPSIFRDPRIQAGLLEAGLHIADSFVPGVRAAFKAAAEAIKAQEGVIETRQNAQGVYEPR
jgi:hypothetical protein